MKWFLILAAGAMAAVAVGWALAAPNPVEPPLASAAEGTDAVACANLIYAGTRSSVCFSDKFLTAVARDTTINTARKFKAVKLADKEIFQFPFCVMTGEGSFALTEAERVNLRRYLERGGFLLASAGCSSRQWDESFRREMRIIFQDRQLEAIPESHEIFHTIYEIKSLGATHGGPPPKLEGLSIGGKVVIIYSSDGLNDTSTMHGCCCCGGNEIGDAQRVNANILAYALLQ
jgi:hypothetical protein